MTFLEVVFAFAMLGIVASALLGVYGFAISNHARQQRWLGAAEVANRLILNYLDSPSGMPEPDKTVEYAVGEAVLHYRWELAEEKLRLVEPRKDQRDRSRESPLQSDRYLNVTVRVWLSEHSGGSRTPEVGTPAVTLARMLDPIYPRNPDSYMAMISNPLERERLIVGFMRGLGGDATPATAAAGFQPSTAVGLAPRDAIGKGRSRQPTLSTGAGR